MKAYLRVVLSVGLVVTMTFNCALAQDSLPNILIILADDLGFADVSYYTGIDASTDLQTPHINTLAEQGIRFNNFYANSTVCSPTRASLMTGRYPGLVGVPGVLRTDPTTSWGYLSPTVATLADHLKAGGYYTGLVGKWHLGLGPPNLPNQRGFNYFHGFLGDMMDDYCDHLRHGVNYMRENDRVLTSEEHEGIHTTELFTNWAIEFIQQRASAGQPFFLYLAYNAPHYPIQPPPCPCQAPPDLDEGVARAELVKLVEDLDANIGRVIGALADAGVKEDTLVIFTSDNGGQWDDVIKDLSDTRANNGPYRGSKGWLYDGGIRVPAVAVWPNRIAAGEASDAVALTMDIFPTLLEVAGIGLPQDIDGASLVPVMEGSGTLPADRLLFWERREGYQIGGAYHAVRSGVWKLVQPHMPTDPFELYDLLEDPHENNERCDEDADICSGLHQLVDGYIGASALVPYRDSLPVDGQAFAIDETVEAEQFDIYITASPSGVYDTGEGAAYHDNEPDNLLDGNWRPGEGVDINASTEASNGYSVGSAQAGEWLAYTMGIPAPGTYRFVGRVASPTGSGTFHVEFLNEDKTGPLVIPDTGGWQSWTQIESDSFQLEPGSQKMRIILDADALGSRYVGNFDWFKIIPADNIALHKPVVASSVEDNDPDLAADKAVDGYPNTRWSSQYSDPQWIAVDLGSRHVISRVVLEWEAAFVPGVCDPGLR